MISAFSTLLIALSAAITCSHDATPVTPNVATPALAVTFENNFDVPVELCWSNFQGGLNSYGTIQPHKETDITTYVGHIWSIRAPGNAPCTGTPLSGYGSFSKPGEKELKKLAKKCPAPAPVLY